MWRLSVESCPAEPDKFYLDIPLAQLLHDNPAISGIKHIMRRHKKDQILENIATTRQLAISEANEATTDQLAISAANESTTDQLAISAANEATESMDAISAANEIITCRAAAEEILAKFSYFAATLSADWINQDMDKYTLFSARLDVVKKNIKLTIIVNT